MHPELSLHRKQDHRARCLLVLEVRSVDSSFWLSTGTAELSFFMAESQDSGVPWTPMQRALKTSSVREADLKLGDHLFTLSLSGQLTVKGLCLEPDLPNRPEGWRLNLSMKVHSFTKTF